MEHVARMCEMTGTCNVLIQNIMRRDVLENRSTNLWNNIKIDIKGKLWGNACGNHFF